MRYDLFRRSMRAIALKHVELTRPSRAIFAILVIVFLQAPAHSGEIAAKNWNELTAAQQTILAPLSDRWDALPAIQRSRILSSARRYPKMNEAQRERFLSRIPKWASLTPTQRDLARDRFQKFSSLPRREREELIRRWRQQQLILKRQQSAVEQSGQTSTVEAPSSASGLIAQ